MTQARAFDPLSFVLGMFLGVAIGMRWLQILDVVLRVLR